MNDVDREALHDWLDQRDGLDRDDRELAGGPFREPTPEERSAIRDIFAHIPQDPSDDLPF